MIVTSRPLDEVRHLRVTPDMPETSTNDHLDFQRCAALHNAIVKHAWISTGGDLNDLPIQHSWPPSDDAVLQEGQERLHSDVISFLERAIYHEEGVFFQFIGILSGGENLWEMVEDLDQDAVALYLSNNSSSPSGADIIYDQENHRCRYDGPCHDGDFPESPAEWQRLETMLSAWLDLIERGKVVALHESIKCMQDREMLGEGLSYEDEQTGARRMTAGIHDPWTVPPYAKQDLADALDAWHSLIRATNDHSPEPKIDLFTSQSLYSPVILERTKVRKHGFAWEFLTKARRPTSSLVFLGPELKLPTEEEVINNRWRRSQEQAESGSQSLPSKNTCTGDTFNLPIPILTGSRQASNWLPASAGYVDHIPWGLYLEACDIEQDFPVEDGCRLALPYSVGANGIAIRADGSALSGTHVRGEFELYQIGQNPCMPCKPTQLHLVLAAFADHVQSGLWKVGTQGVDELDMVFQDADTEGGRDNYVVTFGNFV